MSESGNRFTFTKNFAATTTMRAVGKSVIHACGGITRVDCRIVSERSASRRYGVGLSARRAARAFGSVGNAGCVIVVNVIGIRMTDRLHNGNFGFVPAHSTFAIF